MITARTPSPPEPVVRRWWVATFILIALLLTGGLLVPRLLAGRAEPAAAPPVPLPEISAFPAPAAPPLPPIPARSASMPEDPVRLSGPVPARGKGTFAYARGRGPVAGTGGSLRRFRVAVEHGTNEDAVAFAAQVEATLGDKRGWTGGRRLRLQRVGAKEVSDFTVYLATRDTAGALCARGGVNIRVGGRPYTSCRATGKVIINLDRWRLSAPTYAKAGVPLSVYRQYVINHEVGHELGRHHQGCPKRGGPAPVMVQQTLTLRGCVPYAWPRRGDRELAGPSL
jgi:hypothetical protein